MRNIGSSIGISIVTALLSAAARRSTTPARGDVTPYKPALHGTGSTRACGRSTPSIGLAALNAEITRQAPMIAYLDDFKLMMWVTLAAAPLILLLRKNAKPPSKEAMEAAIE